MTDLCHRCDVSPATHAGILCDLCRRAVLLEVADACSDVARPSPGGACPSVAPEGTISKEKP